MAFLSFSNIVAGASAGGPARSVLFLLILNMSIASGAVILLVLLARLFLRKAPKIFSYALWAVVLFRLLCPVSIATPFSLLGWLDAPAVKNTAHTTAVEYIPYDIFHTPEPEFHASEPAAGIGAEQGVSPPGPVAAPFESWLTPSSTLWLMGMGVLALYSIVSYLRMRRKLIGAVLLQEHIYLADGIGSPFVLGIIRPKIYLPPSLSQQEQGYIILHEQHHIRRGDHIIKLLAFIALCIHWFNPLVWAAFALSSKDMEMSCDEAVVRKLGVGICPDYSASLLSLATGKHIIAGTPLAFGEGDTKSRIKNMLNWKKPKAWITAIAALVCIAVIASCAGNPTPISTPSAPTVDPGADEQDKPPASPELPEEAAVLLGNWVLDKTYTEDSNTGLSLSELFGTALGDYGASLQLSADGQIEFSIGALTGKGTWCADGDTGRYLAELIVYPDERNETLTFYEFRESPDSKTYLVLMYEGYSLHWTQP